MSNFTHPNTFNIGFKSYKIEQKSLKKEKLYGCVDLEKNISPVDPNQTSADYRGTLLHEIMHVALDLFGLGDDDEMPTIGNEYLTHVISNMLQLIQSLNKELFEFIFSDE